MQILNKYKFALSAHANIGASYALMVPIILLFMSRDPRVSKFALNANHMMVSAIMYPFGSAFGSVCTVIFVDRIRRRSVCMYISLCSAIISLVIIIPVDFAYFSVLRFLQGVFAQILANTSCIWLSEITSVNHVHYLFGQSALSTVFASLIVSVMQLFCYQNNYWGVLFVLNVFCSLMVFFCSVITNDSYKIARVSPLKVLFKKQNGSLQALIAFQSISQALCLLPIALFEIIRAFPGKYAAVRAFGILSACGIVTAPMVMLVKANVNETTAIISSVIGFVLFAAKTQYKKPELVIAGFVFTAIGFMLGAGSQQWLIYGTIFPPCLKTKLIGLSNALYNVISVVITVFYVKFQCARVYVFSFAIPLIIASEYMTQRCMATVSTLELGILNQQRLIQDITSLPNSVKITTNQVGYETRHHTVLCEQQCNPQKSASQIIDTKLE
ncbi:Major_facilitator superfamily protein [Hexamita inflata]|uniref:Major facilitator superfamily protein n=1 Tax=Hexamita inflata TaxID=28002 RepID=A0AA86PV23_9EUKA|nr:Major facilitator superfamily protein [Hexamita inflata]